MVTYKNKKGMVIYHCGKPLGVLDKIKRKNNIRVISYYDKYGRYNQQAIYTNFMKNYTVIENDGKFYESELGD